MTSRFFFQHKRGSPPAGRGVRREDHEGRPGRLCLCPGDAPARQDLPLRAAADDQHDRRREEVLVSE